jgi:hypothetical protein
LVLSVDRSLGQIVGLYPIISSCSLDDCVIDLDEHFGIAGPIILVDMLSLEFLWPDNLPEWWCQSMETTPP